MTSFLLRSPLSEQESSKLASPFARTKRLVSAQSSPGRFYGLHKLRSFVKGAELPTVRFHDDAGRADNNNLLRVLTPTSSLVSVINKMRMK